MKSIDRQELEMFAQGVIRANYHPDRSRLSETSLLCAKEEKREASKLVRQKKKNQRSANRRNG